MAHCRYCEAGNKPVKGWHALEVVQGMVAHEVWCVEPLPQPAPKKVLGYYVVKDEQQIAWFRSVAAASAYASAQGGCCLKEETEDGQNECNDFYARGEHLPGVTK